MARGATQEQDMLNTQAGGQLSTAQGLYGSVKSADDKIIANPGYTPAQINTQMDAALTPIAGARADAQAQLGNRAAATRNTAGLISGQDAISRRAMSQGSQAAYGVQANADQTALSERDKAIASEAGLYSPTLSSATSLYGGGLSASQGRQGQKVQLGPLGTFGFS